MSSYLRLGTVPAHVSHPIAAALAGGVGAAGVRAMDVDEDEVIDGMVQKVAQRSAATKETSTATRVKAKKEGVPHMEPFTDNEIAVGRKMAAGVQARLDFPEALVSRNLKMRARNAQTRKTFADTDNRRAA